MTDPTILDHVFIGLLVAYVLYAVFRGQPQMKGQTLDTKAKLSIYWSNGIALWIGAIAAGGVWVLGGRTLTDLGLTWQHEGIVAGVAITAAFVAWFSLESWYEVSTEGAPEKLREQWRRDVPFLPETPRELAHFSIMGVTAGVTEEIVMRGFAISYVAALAGTSTPGLAASVAIPAAVFAFAHRYEGWKAMSRILLLALSFGAIFVVTGSLVIPIVLHVLVDIGAGLTSYLLSNRANGNAEVAAS